MAPRNSGRNPETSRGSAVGPGGGEKHYETFRRVILEYLVKTPDGASIYEIERGVCGNPLVSLHASIELDAMALIYEGLLEEMDDPSRYRLTALGSKFAQLKTLSTG